MSGPVGPNAEPPGDAAGERPVERPVEQAPDDDATSLRAHAKVNLRLRVLQRDEDGYHGLETIFARLDLHDVVSLERTGERIALRVEGEAAAGVPEGTENLCWRAAEAHRSAARDGGAAARITLEKRIPPGTGLGGASADAAAVLRLLDGSSPRPLGERGLVRLAGELGSDVPFALLGVPMALGWERGRRLLPLQPPAVRPALVALPPFPVATKEAYGWLREERARPPDSAGGGAALPGPRRLAAWETLARLAANDFEPVVFRRHPEIEAARGALEEGGALVARLSGSGSALFGVFPDERTRERALARLRERGCGERDGWRALPVHLPV